MVDEGLKVVCVLAPITALFALTIICYIIVKQRQLTRRMIESGMCNVLQECGSVLRFLSGQLVPVMPAVVAYQQYTQPPQQELRSPTTGN